MKNEAAFGYEAWLRHTEKLPRASLHVPLAERFMVASPPLHIAQRASLIDGIEIQSGCGATIEKEYQTA